MALSLLIAIPVIVFLGACDDIESASVSDYSDDYASSQSSADQAANATGRTGDKEVDGILEVAKIMDDIHQAEGAFIAAKSIHLSDPERAAGLLDDAIALRPEDMRFHRARADIAMRQDDLDIARQQWEEQDRIAASQGMDDQLWYWIGSFEDADNAERRLRASTEGMDASAFKANFIVIHTRMYVTLERMADLYTMDAQPEMARAVLAAAANYRDMVKEAGGP